MLSDRNGGRVAAVGIRAFTAHVAAVGLGKAMFAFAVLFQTFAARAADTATVHHAAHTNDLSRFEP